MMSKCSKCGGFSFEIKETSPRGSKYKFLFVQCSGCGVPVGVVEYMHTHTTIQETNQKLKDLENKLDNTGYLLNQVVNTLNQMVVRMHK